MFKKDAKPLILSKQIEKLEVEIDKLQQEIAECKVAKLR